MDDRVRLDLSEIKTDIAEMKVDLKHHVKRTDDLQKMVEPLVDLRKEIKGAINLIYLLAAIAAIIETARLFIK